MKVKKDERGNDKSLPNTGDIYCRRLRLNESFSSLRLQNQDPKGAVFWCLGAQNVCCEDRTPDLSRSKISILGKENPGVRRCSPGGTIFFFVLEHWSPAFSPGIPTAPNIKIERHLYVCHEHTGLALVQSPHLKLKCYGVLHKLLPAHILLDRII